MKFVNFTKRIRNYAIASFLVPLIAINSCLLIYKFLANNALSPNLIYNEKKVEYTFAEYTAAFENLETWTFPYMENANEKLPEAVFSIMDIPL